MDAMRVIQKVENGQVCLQLPDCFWGQEVEIIVLRASSAAAPDATASRNSVRGSLKRYAKPELISSESEAWALAASAKHESC